MFPSCLISVRCGVVVACGLMLSMTSCTSSDKDAAKQGTNEEQPSSDNDVD